VWPGQARHIEAEEEKYFNADDDEDDEFVPAISSQGARGQAPPSSVNRKRKRRAAPLSIMKALRSSPPTRGPSLVDYNDDDDDVRESGVADDDSILSLRSLSPSSAKASSRTPLMPSVSITSHPKLVHRHASASPPPRPSSSSSSSTDDDEDNLLESLVRSKPSRPSLAMSSKFGMGVSRASEKRRRDQEDEGLLEHLIKSKKPDLGFDKSRVGTSGRVGSAKSGDDPPKKIKLKFGATSFSLASSSPAPSEPGAKDGDTG
jgi:protein phosphatase-4 regulatory subunit 3